MNALLLDASVWLAALDPDDVHHGGARRLLEASAAGRATLAALDLTLYEIANVAVTRWRSKDDAARLVELAESACSEMIERVDAELLKEAATIAAEHELTVYDAAYVACARRRDWTLVSGDVSDLVEPGLAVSPDVAATAAELDDQDADY